MHIRRESVLSFVASFILAASVSAQTITEFPIPTTGSSPVRITAGPDGSLWFTEYTYDSGVGITLAGSGSPGSADGAGTSASFRGPNGLAVDSSGNVYVADRHNPEDHILGDRNDSGGIGEPRERGSVTVPQQPLKEVKMTTNFPP